MRVALALVALRVADARTAHASHHARPQDAVLFPNRSALGAGEHVCIMHFPKTGGTSLRSFAMSAATSLGKDLQTAYEAGARTGLPRFDAGRPATFVVGHHVGFGTLRGARVRYATMVRNPHAWLYSLRLDLAASGHWTGATWTAFLEAQLDVCPALDRGAADARCDAPNATNANMVYAWAAGLPAAAAGCGALVDWWTRPSRLLLVTERFGASLWLLATLLGLAPPAAPPRENARGGAAYETRVTLGSERALADALADTCVPDVYVAARRRFEDAVQRARAYCGGGGGPCDLAFSAVGRDIWPPEAAAAARS